MKPRKKFLFIFTFLLLSLSVNFASAIEQWNTAQLTGTWGTLTPELGFNGSGDNVGQLGTMWNQSISNFTAFKLNVTLNDFEAIGRLMSFYDSKTIDISLAITSNIIYGEFNITVRLFSAIDVFGLKTKEIQIGAYKLNIDNGTQVVIYVLRDMYTNNTCEVKIGVFDPVNGNTQLPNGTIIQGFWTYFNQTVNTNYINASLFGTTYNGTDFFSRPIVPYLFITHSGSGNFSFYALGNEYSNGNLPEIIGGIEAQKVIENIFGFFQGIVNFFQGAWNLITTLWNIVLTVINIVLPYIPWIGLMYLLDAGVRSVHERSFRPIGYVFLQGYTLLIGFLGVIATLISGLANLLPF